MVKIAKGLLGAAASFAAVGIALPFLLEYFSPYISAYGQLPPPFELWAVFLLFGGLFGVTSFLQGAYSKGEFPWLFGKVGSGVMSVVFYTYLLFLLPKGTGSTGIEGTGLLDLVYLAIALSYGYLVLDFMDARRSRMAKPQAATMVSP